MNARAYTLHALLLVVCVAVCVLAANSARAQLEPQTPEELEDQAQEFAQRRETWTLGGHGFVSPVSLMSAPFEFALPVSQLDSRTQIGTAGVDGERDQGDDLGTTRYVLATQVYDLSLRLWKRFEVALAAEGQAAAGIDGESIVAGGLGAAGGPKLSLAYQLIRLQQIAVLARLSARVQFGHRANIQPLLFQAQAMPLELLDAFDPALVGYPTKEGAVSLGLGAAVAVSRSISVQLSARVERIETLVKPWLQAKGSEAAGARELGYQAWSFSAGVAMGIYYKRVLFQPQFALARREDTLTSPRQDRGPYSKVWSLVPVLQVMFLASPVLQMGGGVGLEIAPTDVQDVYENRYSTHSTHVFVPLVARYIWGQ